MHLKLSIQFAIGVATFMSFAGNSLFGQSNRTSPGLKELQWLNGSWVRTNSKPGKIDHERWSITNSNEMIGFGVTMKSSDTLFVEKLKIIRVDSGVYYVADVPENKQPVPFKLTSSTATTFIFENTKHDFPKRLEYKREGENLHVVVSGDGKSIDYLFIKN